MLRNKVNKQSSRGSFSSLELPQCPGEAVLTGNKRTHYRSKKMGNIQFRNEANVHKLAAPNYHSTEQWYANICSKRSRHRAIDRPFFYLVVSVITRKGAISHYMGEFQCSGWWRLPLVRKGPRQFDEHVSVRCQVDLISQ